MLSKSVADGDSAHPARGLASRNETEHASSLVAASSERDQTVPFAMPDIDERDIQAVVDVLRSGWITSGPKVREFESSFAQFLGVRHAVALNSATAALHLALDAIHLAPGDEVIVPTMTFTASAEVCRYFDGIPVMVDIEPDTLCIDPVAVERAITPRTRAIMPVHVAGHPAEMDALTALADAHNLSVIEDAAHSFPCYYRGQTVGAIGDIGAFSFYATKTITTAEGGMLTTNDDDLAERARIMSLHGMSRDSWKRYTKGGSWRYDVVAPGFKYNMTDIAAALGITQFAKAGRLWERRREIAERYSGAFRGLAGLEVPTVRPDVQHSWHLYVLRLRLEQLTIDRDAFLRELNERGVMTSVHFIPVHSFTYYRTTYGYEDRDFPVACREFQRIFSLPIYPSMTDVDVDRVIQVVAEVTEQHCR